MVHVFPRITVSTIAIVGGLLLIATGVFAHAPICAADGVCSSPNLQPAISYILVGLLLGGGGLAFGRR